MKTYIVSAVAVMAVFLTFGMAYAIDDQMPTDIGLTNIDPVVHDTKDWSTKDGGLTAEFSGEEIHFFGPSGDLGIVLARDAETFSTKGAAAGGLGASAADKAVHPAADNWYGLAY